VRVCLVIEGSYPYITGGVSSWVHELIAGLADIEFVLFTFSPMADQKLRYELPPNVVEHRDVVLSKFPESIKGKFSARAALKAVLGAHGRMFAGETPDAASFFSCLPEGRGLHRIATLDSGAWKIIAAQNTRRNPLYPFADYYWAWRSAHDLLFTTLAAKAPEADLYHSLSTGFAGLAALAAKQRHGKPFLLTEHGLYHKEREIEIRKASFVRGYQRDMWIRLYNRLASLCYRNADLCTSLFEENRRKQIEIEVSTRAVGAGGVRRGLGAAEEKTIVIPNGIDVARFSVTRERRDENLHVGFVGRVVPIKDVKTFIVAAKLVLDREPRARFHIVGPDDEDPKYARECRELTAGFRLEDRLFFTGRKDVREYYRFLDCLVLTSVREAQPLVILEAWAAGIPVVSTDVGNVSELLEGDRRFIAPVKDADGIAEGILYILSHPDEMAALNERNKKKVIARYEKKDLLLRYGELYRRFAPKESAAAGEKPSRKARSRRVKRV